MRIRNGRPLTPFVIPHRCLDPVYQLNLKDPFESERASTAYFAGRADKTIAMRILVVDDDTGASRALQVLLEAEGHQVRIAGSLTQACEALIDWLPHLLLIDIDLPDGSGWDLAGRLRLYCEDPLPPCVAVTARHTRLDFARSREAGFQAHLVKPILLEELRSAIEAAV